MNPLTRLALMAGLALAAAAPSSMAQGSGNRELHRFAVVPDPTPGSTEFVVVAIWTVDVEPTTVPLDFSTFVTLSVDGTPVQRIQTDVIVNPGSGLGCQAAPPCGGACGTGFVDGESVTLICYEDCDTSGCECDCGVWVDTHFDPFPLTSGQVVQVLLTRVPGTVPDNDSSDDGQDQPHEEPIGWLRQPEAIELLPLGAGLYDVRVPIGLEWEGFSGRLDLDTIAELFVNGSLQRTVTVPALAEQNADVGCLVSGCGPACGSLNGVTSDCDPLLWFGCGCGTDASVLFAGVALQTGDEIRVLLRPAPGALPELPGFDGDDEITLVCCGTVSVDAPGQAAGLRLDQNLPNPFNPTTTITFELVRPGATRLRIFDASGRLLRVLLDRPLSAGVWSVTWDGRSPVGEPVPSGQYFYELTTPEGTETRRMTLVK